MGSVRVFRSFIASLHVAEIKEMMNRLGRGREG